MGFTAGLSCHVTSRSDNTCWIAINRARLERAPTSSDRSVSVPRCVSVKSIARRSAINGGKGVLSRRHGITLDCGDFKTFITALLSSCRTHFDFDAFLDQRTRNVSNTFNPSFNLPGIESPALMAVEPHVNTRECQMSAD